MAFSSKDYHLIRYFFLLGVLIYLLHSVRWNDDIMLIFTGPVTYLAFWVRSIVAVYIKLPVKHEFNEYFLVLPGTILYFTGIGFLLKQILLERGIVRHFTIIAFAAFLAYLHFTAWRGLTAYFVVPETLS